MKTTFQIAALVVVFSTLNSQHSTCFAQGSLTPPGAPAATMKTLSQIEPRTAITSSGAVTISQPGSYYLTTNITVSSGVAISIATNDVTLDLNGFTVRSTAPSATGTAIDLAAGNKNISIYNGLIESGVTNNGSGVYAGSGFGFGVAFSGSTPVNVRVSQVQVSGCRFYGIYIIGDCTLVEHCGVKTTGSYGIQAFTVQSSFALDCGGDAITSHQCFDSRGESTGGVGVSSIVVENSFGKSSNSDGINCSTAQNCYGQSDGVGSGVSAITVLNCAGSGASGFGISTTTAENSYGVSTSGFGVSAITALNCAGISSSSRGLFAKGMQGCYGQSGADAGLSTSVGGLAVGCRAVISKIGISALDGSTVRDCVVSSCTSNGITAGLKCSVINCTVTGSGGHGIFADSSSVISDCNVRGSTLDGIRFTDWCLVKENNSNQNGNAGIHATGGSNRIQGNNAIVNAQNGIKADTLANLILQNSARGNGTNYNLVANNVFGAIVDRTAPASGAVTGSSAASSAGSTDPWANFSY